MSIPEDRFSLCCPCSRGIVMVVHDSLLLDGVVVVLEYVVGGGYW
jgi:hypothetical protein